MGLAWDIYDHIATRTERKGRTEGRRDRKGGREKWGETQNEQGQTEAHRWVGRTQLPTPAGGLSMASWLEEPVESRTSVLIGARTREPRKKPSLDAE